MENCRGTQSLRILAGLAWLFGDPIWPAGEEPQRLAHELAETVHAL